MPGPNETLARRWFEEVWNQRRESVIDEMLPRDVLIHGLGPEPSRGTEAFKQFYRAYLDAVTGLRISVDHAVESGDRVYVHCTVTGTHKKAGRPFKFAGGVLMRTANGRIVEGWNAWNFLDFLVQVDGAAPDSMAKALQ
jgi:ketosteroid isomerase-like protein